MITALLIANRGEIACRIARTARDMGVRTIAVYSEADAGAPHVLACDQAILIGPAPVADSYLNSERIIEAALKSGADAVHPGYGFLSENAAFAAAIAEAGLTFVGPPVNAIDVMGDKARAKRAMIAAGVPCVPGYQGEDQSDDRLVKEAETLGFPLMVKAAAGGGGRGMRLVERANDLADALTRARAEAQSAFGAGDLILERAIRRPRHVELQVFADAHGGVIHLGERDCSVQRRHQKVLEEAPCPMMTANLRAEMGAAAVAAARAVDYRGAGTVEFLLDDQGFYFLEMNTRLQVEHPVTELVTGVDLVEWQLRIADGSPLPMSQDELRLDGHAMEARLYAEDPAAGFLPLAGPVRLWRPAPGARTDAGIATGGEISAHYDPMAAKIIAYGPDRETARRRLVRALEETAFLGAGSNREFLIDAVQRPAFVNGEATTAFIEEEYGEAFEARRPSEPEIAFAAALLMELSRKKSAAMAISVAPELMGWRSAGGPDRRVDLLIDEVIWPVEFTDGLNRVAKIGENDFAITDLHVEAPEARAKIAGRKIRGLFVFDEANGLEIALEQITLKVRERPLGAEAVGTKAAGRLTAPMHGQLLELRIAEGDIVAAGQVVAVLEAMKMQHEITAPGDGRVTAIATETGAQIAAGDVIAEIETEEAA